MKVGIIGFGNMAQAIAKGWISQKVLEPQNILATAANYSRLQSRAEKLGITAMESNEALAQEADWIILAVKPHLLQSALQNCKEILLQKPVVSVAVNKPYDAIEELLPTGRHISILPNLPVEVGKGVIVCEDRFSLSQDERAQFERLFAPLGSIVVLPYSQFGIAGTISGCGPAFAALFVEGLSEAGVQYGLPRSLSYELVLQMLEGSAALMAANHIHPAILKDMVCSPAGTTIKGVNSLKVNGFEGDLIQAVQAIQS